MINFTGDDKGTFKLTNVKIKSKEMYMAIPYLTTKKQMEVINKSIDYARLQGVNVIVKKVN
ncbi:hypothetical protein ACFGX8_05035 [Pasteurella multocida]|uniref:endonuclease toxin domain-containing protein n=1 Tax=Pasteurella multocida TaxID=747 RepID=UPI0009F40F7B|nr:hypothetical protein [Pasteurella multocida]PNM04433.1 hypothetical protein A6J89_011830 [Pasteurella multocida]